MTSADDRELNVRLAEKELQEAKAVLAVAERQYARLRKMVAIGAVGQQELDAARLKFERERLRVEQAEAVLKALQQRSDNPPKR